ncbi:hypothetical protein IQ260_26090 [Leptolyngbya cf. ectocarpi LEGE 11479]|uniref:Uncharacterized protein n=1 Tax=Leptolyngbya cf. ectocarpi LEGE 11479 TaxID=1828722 RepID=A0A929FCJ0_LEPEC|nr:hypothetical protein [Leptolyngbya ectocarpi]MBE9070117.1 hypothetical protein [Leptolyngbya cf. ectocarpi LEGE 11479]
MQNIKLTIHFDAPQLEADAKERLVENLMLDLKEIDEVESINKVRHPSPPVNSKSLGGFIVGLLTAEVSAKNAKHLLSYLGTRLESKPIELEVESEGRHLKVKAHNREELAFAVKTAQDFIAK